MKGAWPKVSASISFDFSASHAMTRIGCGCELPHVHAYTVTFGWTHEIQPTSGFTHEVSKQRRAFERIVSMVRDRDLNEILPMQPSAEVLALWLLAQTEPAYCDYVIVNTYGDYTARVDRRDQRSEWLGFLAGRCADPFSNESFTLK